MKNISTISIQTHFSDFFAVSAEAFVVEDMYNPSLINDTPLFIDPFLIFAQQDDQYNQLHTLITNYTCFLKSLTHTELSDTEMQSFFYFKEIKQTWLGFATNGNNGRGLGKNFATTLRQSFQKNLSGFGIETICHIHIEKLCLLGHGLSTDSVSDLTTSIIVDFLANKTEIFAHKYIDPKHISSFEIPKAFFDFKKKQWCAKSYQLPSFNDEYILLVPRAILSAKQTWINNNDKIKQFRQIVQCIPDLKLTESISDFFETETQKLKDLSEIAKFKIVAEKCYQNFPEITDYYISTKEKCIKQALQQSEFEVKHVEQLYHDLIREIIEDLIKKTEFYGIDHHTIKLEIFKHWIESQDGWKYFYKDTHPIITNETSLNLFLKLIWNSVRLVTNITQEYKVKLASNTQWSKNIENLEKCIIFCFDTEQVQASRLHIQTLEKRVQCVTIDCSYRGMFLHSKHLEFDQLVLLDAISEVAMDQELALF
jgi:hypothetical protein